MIDVPPTSDRTRPGLWHYLTNFSLPPNLKSMQHDLAMAWASAALLGAGWISTVSAESPFRHIVPIGVMCAYVLYGLQRSGRNTARLADSVYFLGFLWTLYALIVTLTFKKAQIQASDVFAVFGYALTTTAAGMFLRLVLIQFQRTIPDQLLEARPEIDSRVQAFVQELETSQRTLRIFSDTASTTLEQWSTDFQAATTRVISLHEAAHRQILTTESTRLSDALNDIVGELARLKAVCESLRESSSEYKEHLVSVTKDLGSVLTSLRSTLARRVTAFEEKLRTLELQLSAVEIPPTLMRDAVAAAVVGVQREAGNIARAAEEAIVAVNRRLNALLTDGLPEGHTIVPIVTRLGESLGAVDHRAQLFRGELEHLGASLNVVVGGLQSLASLPNTLNELQRHLLLLTEAVTERAADRSVEAERAIRQARELGDRLGRAVEEVLAFVREKLDQG